MPSPALKGIYINQENNQTASLCGWEEGETVDGGGKVTHERTTDADEAKVTAKKRRNNCEMQTKTRLKKKDNFGKPCTVAINTSPSVYLRQLDNLTAGKDGGTDEGGVLGYAREDDRR